MEKYTRTDLACEKISDVAFSADDLGKICQREIKNGFEIIRLAVEEDVHSTLLSKPKGNYVTIHCGAVWHLGEEELENLEQLLSCELRKMCYALCGQFPNKDFSVLVAGLGNEDITADAIGPQAIRKLTATRHLRKLDSALYDTVGRCEISALFTGVLGQTGMETVELVRGAVENVRPHLVVAVDALAARSSERLAATVQLCDCGIAPGSGVGNQRKAISKETIGVPVISVGVPTVVESSTLVWDVLANAGIRQVSGELKRVLENGKSFFVTPKESDVITSCVSRLLATAIDRAFWLDKA